MANHLNQLITSIQSQLDRQDLPEGDHDAVAAAIGVLGSIPCKHEPESETANWGRCLFCGVALKRVWVVDEV